MMVVLKSDGSCLGFDLLEPESLFDIRLSWPGTSHDYSLTTPAYDTSFLSLSKQMHHDESAIVGLTVVQSDYERLLLLKLSRASFIFHARAFQNIWQHKTSYNGPQVRLNNTAM